MDSQFEIIGPRKFWLEILFGAFFGNFPESDLRGLLGIFLAILADLPDLRILTQVRSG
jgi:hypothetical protein